MAGHIENSRRAPIGPAPIGYPAKLAGTPGALIFFCFFSSIKRRKEDHEARESCIKARKEEGSKQKSHEKQIKGRRFTPHIRGQGVGLSCLAPNPSAKAPRRPQTALHRFAQLPNHPSTTPNRPAQMDLGLLETCLGAARGGWALPTHGWGLNHTFARML